MEEPRDAESATIRREDLDVVVGATELSRRLASHTHCVLADCGGRAESGDLSAETEALFEALLRYAAVAREVGTGYGTTLRTPIPELQLLLDPDREPGSTRAD